MFENAGKKIFWSNKKWCGNLKSSIVLSMYTVLVHGFQVMLVSETSLLKFLISLLFVSPMTVQPFTKLSSSSSSWSMHVFRLRRLIRAILDGLRQVARGLGLIQLMVSATVKPIADWTGTYLVASSPSSMVNPARWLWITLEPECAGSEAWVSLVSTSGRRAPSSGCNKPENTCFAYKILAGQWMRTVNAPTAKLCSTQETG